MLPKRKTAATKYLPSNRIFVNDICVWHAPFGTKKSEQSCQWRVSSMIEIRLPTMLWRLGLLNKIINDSDSKPSKFDSRL